jgi:hypothetical protein
VDSPRFTYTDRDRALQVLFAGAINEVVVGCAA